LIDKYSTLRVTYKFPSPDWFLRLPKLLTTFSLDNVVSLLVEL